MSFYMNTTEYDWTQQSISTGTEANDQMRCSSRLWSSISDTVCTTFIIIIIIHWLSSMAKLQNDKIGR